MKYEIERMEIIYTFYFFLPFWKKWLKNYWHFVTGKTAKSILISVGVRLAAFNLKQIANLTCTDELDLYSIGEKKVALFCCIPDADTSMNYLVGMHWLLRIIRSLSVTHRPMSHIARHLFWRGNWIYDIVDFRTCFLSFGTLLGNILSACGKAGWNKADYHTRRF